MTTLQKKCRRPARVLGARNAASAITIHFEDHGQDFLEWDIAPDGSVIGCRPFQFSTWSKCKVIAPRQLKVGDQPKIYSAGGNPLTLNYKIIEIEKGGAA